MLSVRQFLLGGEDGVLRSDELVDEEVAGVVLTPQLTYTHAIPRATSMPMNGPMRLPGPRVEFELARATTLATSTTATRAAASARRAT
ncbi:hypothetical protein GCM10009763_21270 [Dermacoccus profundi]|uniref:Uncharacterized protein n=1 Tax=Dermacoccus profundi TaxID=322602 RepID=A0ABN2DBA9_9MICO